MALTVLHVAAPAPMGGLESVVRMLAVGQRARGHSVHVALVVEPGHDPPLAKQLADVGVAVHIVTVSGRAYLTERSAIRALGRRIAADVVHTHGYRPDIVAGLAARSLGVPFVSTLHGFVGGSRRGRLNEWLQCRALRSAAAAIAVSRPIVARLQSAGVSSDRIHLVPNAWGFTDPSVERTAARSALGIGPEEFVVGWVGRLGHEKGPDVFVDAILAAPELPISVSIVGEGRLRAPLEAQARAAGPAGDRIQWHGAIAGASRYFSAFDAYVLSSRTEGTPISLLEAMAAGVPAIVTSVGGVPDVVSSTEALIVPSETPGALAAAIREVLDDPAAAEARARAARHRLETQFAVGPWIDRHDAVYNQVRAEHQRRTSSRKASR